jgi:polar amino acid transport system permease protein
MLAHSFFYLCQAAGVTIAVSLAGIAIGFPLGAIVSAGRVSGKPAIVRAAGAYISIFRGVPLLVQLLFIYYFLAKFGIDVPALVAAVGGLALASSAYVAEILRGALNAVPKGQAEAAVACGFTSADVWIRVLLPQALRLSIPPLINEFILLLKASSLVSVVGIAELTRVGMNIASLTYRPLPAYLAVGAFYLAITLCLSALGHYAERRLAGARGS